MSLPPDAGLHCLALLARFQHLDLDADSLRHELALHGPSTGDDLLRAAQRCGMRARIVHVPAERISGATLPAIAFLRGGPVVLARTEPDRFLIQDPSQRVPRILSAAEFASEYQGRLLLTRPARPAAPGGAGAALRRVGDLLAKYRSLLLEVLAASFAVNLLALASPLFFQVVIDKVLVHQGLTTLDMLCLGLALLALFEAVLSSLRSYVLTHTAHRMDAELAAGLFRHVLALPLAWFASRTVGDSVARVREMETLRAFATGTALTTLLDALFGIVFMALLFFYSAPLAWLVVATLPAYALVSLAITPGLRRRLEERAHFGAATQAGLIEAVSAIETVKGLAMEPQLRRRWEERLAASLRASAQAGLLGTAGNQAAQFVGRLSLAGILWLGAREVVGGTLTVGELVAFNMLAMRISGPVLRVLQLWQELQQVRLSAQRVNEILAIPTETGAEAGRRLQVCRGGLEFERVTFRYSPGEPAVLHELQLAIRPGEVVGIVGASGSGKSTVARLLQRLLLPEHGHVRLDGTDLRHLDPAWLRRQVGVVQQDAVLFDASVRENIALADPGLSLDRVMAAARLAGAHEFILQLPQGYDSPVGERGCLLSGGQRQRLAIARALAGDPRVLVFDEATSALDYESERLIRQNLPAMARGRTVLLIAHRLSLVRTADRIVVLSRGRIVEQGAHPELLAQRGWYARAHDVQAGAAA